MNKNNKIIAITGNIGSGKSTVMAMLAESGYKTLSADEFTNTAYISATPALVVAFGDGILENGEISRKNLAKIAFESAENLQKLNDIMHPIIFQLIFAECCDDAVSFVEVPLLFESGMENYFSSVWLIKASEQNKISRASKRDNATSEEIAKRLSFQKNHEEKTIKCI